MGIIELFLLALLIVGSPLIAICAIVTFVIILLFLIAVVFCAVYLLRLFIKYVIGLFGKKKEIEEENI